MVWNFSHFRQKLLSVFLVYFFPGCFFHWKNTANHKQSILGAGFGFHLTSAWWVQLNGLQGGCELNLQNYCGCRAGARLKAARSGRCRLILWVCTYISTSYPLPSPDVILTVNIQEWYLFSSSYFQHKRRYRDVCERWRYLV